MALFARDTFRVFGAFLFFYFFWAAIDVGKLSRGMASFAGEMAASQRVETL